MDKKSKSALIIGFGRMGQLYCQILKEFGFLNIEIVDKKTKNLTIANREYGISKNFISRKIKKKHSSTKYQIVILSTTTDAKFISFKKIASKNTKLIFFEKPLCSSLKECIKIKLLSQKFGIKIGINHQSRFTYEVEKILRMVKNYKKDDLKSLSLIAGNIGIAMNGVHIVELFNFLTKNPINKVNASFEKKLITNPRGRKFRDFAGQIICKNKKNNILTIHTSNAQGHGFNLIFTFKNGFIFLDYLNGNLYFNFRKKNFFKKKSNFYGLPSVVKNTKIKVSSIKDGTKKNLNLFLKNKLICNLKEGTDAIKVLSAAHFSSLNDGKTVSLEKFKSKNNFKWA